MLSRGSMVAVSNSLSLYSVTENLWMLTIHHTNGQIRVYLPNPVTRSGAAPAEERRYPAALLALESGAISFIQTGGDDAELETANQTIGDATGKTRFPPGAASVSRWGRVYKPRNVEDTNHLLTWPLFNERWYTVYCLCAGAEMDLLLNRRTRRSSTCECMPRISS